MFYGGKGTAILSDKQVFPHLFPFFGIFFVFTTETRYGDCAGNVRVRVEITDLKNLQLWQIMQEKCWRHC